MVDCGQVGCRLDNIRIASRTITDNPYNEVALAIIDSNNHVPLQLGPYYYSPLFSSVAYFVFISSLQGHFNQMENIYFKVINSYQF